MIGIKKVIPTDIRTDKRRGGIKPPCIPEKQNAGEVKLPLGRRR
jgi:hypothetical protein